MSAPCLVTGCAGFIGFHLCSRLLAEGYTIVGIDNLNDYYDVQLKKDRLSQLCNKGMEFHCQDIAESKALKDLFLRKRFSHVYHLAAQAGVRFSQTNPDVYVSSNIQGFLNILECCRESPVEHLIFASSSSVYGANKKIPFATADPVDRPISFYGVTKKANELMAHSYAWNYRIPITGLRFFTVYGPWGRPDMALYIFTRALLAEKPVALYNFGQMKRDFTYVDDVVESIVRLKDKAPVAPEMNIFNVGSSNPVELRQFLAFIEEGLGKQAQIEHLPLQPGDVVETLAQVSELEDYIGYRPNTSLQTGITRSLKWYNEYMALRIR